MRLIITDTAKADLKTIYKHTKDNDPRAAKKLVTELSNKVIYLAKSGITGSPRDSISKGLRAFPYKNRCFYFRIVDDAMILIRVTHQRQDLDIIDFIYPS